MKRLIKQFVPVLSLVLFLVSCSTYDESFDWMEDQPVSGLNIAVSSVKRGEVEFTMTNESSEPLSVLILPQTTIIGYTVYLDSATGRNRKPGELRGDEPRWVRAWGSSFGRSSNKDVYGRVSMSYNDFTIEPGETLYTQLSLYNWDKATENFLYKVHFLVKDGESRDRIVMYFPAELFFPSSSSISEKSSVQ